MQRKPLVITFTDVGKKNTLRKSFLMPGRLKNLKRFIKFFKKYLAFKFSADYICIRRTNEMTNLFIISANFKQQLVSENSQNSQNNKLYLVLPVG